MPRGPRVKNEFNIYHVMLRGINRQQVFLEPEDDALFLDVLRECKALSGFKIYAYCLMGNHIHLLIRAEDEDISVVMKRIGIRFVQRINRRYGRSGHLFQDRYKSEVVKDDVYLLNLVRYIHQNPVKAGIAASAAEYLYSSYRDYVNQYTDPLTDTDYVFSIIDLSRFLELMDAPVSGTFLDIPEKPVGLSDQKAISLIRKIARVQEMGEVQRLDTEKMDPAIVHLLAKGVSVRQLSRLTGIPRGHVDSVNRRRK